MLAARGGASASLDRLHTRDLGPRPSCTGAGGDVHGSCRQLGLAHGTRHGEDEPGAGVWRPTFHMPKLTHPIIPSRCAFAVGARHPFSPAAHRAEIVARERSARARAILGPRRASVVGSVVVVARVAATPLLRSPLHPRVGSRALDRVLSSMPLAPRGIRSKTATARGEGAPPSAGVRHRAGGWMTMALRSAAAYFAFSEGVVSREGAAKTNRLGEVLQVSSVIFLHPGKSIRSTTTRERM